MRCTQTLLQVTTANNNPQRENKNHHIPTILRHNYIDVTFREHSELKYFASSKQDYVLIACSSFLYRTQVECLFLLFLNVPQINTAALQY